MKKIVLMASVMLALYSCKKEGDKLNEAKTEQTSENPKAANKIVTLSGGITEIVSALGHESEIVGTDVTSTYPKELKSTAKDLGHVRSMTIEPIMALSPTLILASDKDLNPELLKKYNHPVLNRKYSNRNSLWMVLKINRTSSKSSWKHRLSEIK